MPTGATPKTRRRPFPDFGIRLLGLALPCNRILYGTKKTRTAGVILVGDVDFRAYRNRSNTFRTALAAKRASPPAEIWTRRGSSHPFVIHQSSVGESRRHPSASAHTVRKPIRAGSTDRIRQTPAAGSTPGRASRSTPVRRPGSLFFDGATLKSP